MRRSCASWGQLGGNRQCYCLLDAWRAMWCHCSKLDDNWCCRHGAMREARLRGWSSLANKLWRPCLAVNSAGHLCNTISNGEASQHPYTRPSPHPTPKQTKLQLQHIRLTSAAVRGRHFLQLWVLLLCPGVFGFCEASLLELLLVEGFKGRLPVGILCVLGCPPLLNARGVYPSPT